jgi:hypothetical protein
MTLLPTVAAFREIRITAKQIAARVSQEPPLIPGTGNGSTERPADEEISKHNPAAQANLRRGRITAGTPSAGTENRALQPDILIMLRTDSKRGNEYSSKFSMENAIGGAWLPGSFVRYRVLAGAGR